MSKNKLYNRSYFCKRLIDAGFYVIKLNIPFQKDDYRKWIIVVNPNKNVLKYNFNIFVTCYKNEQTKQFSFKFQGQNFQDFILDTKSMRLIIKIFNKTIELFDTEQPINEQKTAFNETTVQELIEQEKDTNE